MTTTEWKKFLSSWNEILISKIEYEPLSMDELIASDMLNNKILSNRWLGYPGATENSIKAIEQKIGMVLPPSYRNFLLISDGFRQPGNLVPKLLSIKNIDWYRVNHQETIDIWNDESNEILTDDPDAFSQYLQDALQISAEEYGGSAVYLLNPKVITDNGEWEALYFASWIPGADRYPSFWDLMQNELKVLGGDD